MPEEKVKQYKCLCPCEHKTGCIACENGNHDYHLVPPAADAGPRQPHAIVIHKIPHCVCGHAHDAGNICSRCACRVAKLCNCAQAAAPVPQEAAPHSKKCAEQLYSSMDAKCICGSDTVQATAPDSAMRVAEQIYDNYGNSDWDKDDWCNLTAALIRQAGSERERNTVQILRECKQMLESLRYVSSCDLPSELEQKISRLLGGEAK